MKKLISYLFVVIIIVSIAIPVSASTTEISIQPRWAYLDTVTAYLDINWLGVATCEGRATAGSLVTIKVVVRLQQLQDTGWATLKTWTATNTQTASSSGNYAVYSGYTYRVTVTGYVYDSNGTIIETGSATDTFVY